MRFEADTPTVIEPKESTYEAFPASALTAQGMRVLPADLSGRSCMIYIGVEYAQKSGMRLHLHIIEPRQPEGENAIFPLAIFIQGSAWFAQNTGAELAQLALRPPWVRHRSHRVSALACGAIPGASKRHKNGAALHAQTRRNLPRRSE